VRGGKARAVAVLAVVVCSLVAGSPAQSASPSKGEGTGHRHWVTSAQSAPTSPQQFGVVTAPALIPMRDGEMLRAVLYLPSRPPTDAPGPCIGVLDGYAPPSAIAALGGVYATILGDYATRGYAGVYVHLRAIGVPADQALYYKYASDGYDVVEWMAKQSWCNGRVGLRGTSLLGISQWFAAKGLPPHLKAMVPDVACGDCYWGLWYVGGMIAGSGRKGRTPPSTAYDEYAAARPHRNYDAWWRERTIMPSDREKIARKGVKVLIFGGWDDYMLWSYTHNYMDYRAAKGDAKIILGPWTHGQALLGGTAVEPYSFNNYQTLFFDRWLKGIHNGIDRENRALIYVQGPNEWRFEREWPIPDTNYVTFNLRARRSGTAPSLNDGSLTFATARPHERSVGYTYSPTGPYNDAGGGGARLTNDQRGDEQRSLTWTTPAVQTPTEITGRPNLNFWAKVVGPDTDFVAELTDVGPDGTSTQIARGWLNAPRFFDRSHPKPLRMGIAYKFKLELWPTSYVLAAGHRLRLDLSGSDSTGNDPNPYPSRVTILQDAAHPSALIVPLIGDSRLVRAYRGFIER